MQTIIQKNYFFAAAFGVSIIANALILACLITSGFQPGLPFVVTVVASGLPAGLWIREYKRLKSARLIVETQILCIRPAVISNGNVSGSETEEAECLEVFVSYFGILLDSRIIKFNQNGILLRAVEIGCDFISLTYGTGTRVQSTRLLRATIENVELEKIVERFIYETGIAPVVIN